jgi:alpha-tubulin suppressor-like RCC1 family protein
VDVLHHEDAIPPPKEAGVTDAPTETPDVVTVDAPSLPDRVVPAGDLLFENVAAANSDTCGVSSGRLYCFGAAPDGRTRNTPERLGSDTSWVQVSSGLSAHCALRRDETVWCWGIDDQGQLGQGDTTTRLEPTRVTLPRAATRVRGRYASFCATLDDGSLYCWGANEEGQLAQNEPLSDPAPDRLQPVRVGTDVDWTDVDVGQGHGCGIRSGSLYCWGRNTEGELGVGDGAGVQLRTPTRSSLPATWTSIAAGQSHSCGIREPGGLFCFGDASIGALGLGDTDVHAVPAQVGTDEDWTSIELDTFHTCGIRAPGTLWCWGRNIEGQLGVGDTTDHPLPTRVGDFSDWVQVSVGRFHTCGRRRGGTLWCAGANDNGRIGTGDYVRRNVFTEVAPALP